MYDNDDDTAAYCDWSELSTDSLCVESCLHNNIPSQCQYIHTHAVSYTLTLSKSA